MPKRVLLHLCVLLCLTSFSGISEAQTSLPQPSSVPNGAQQAEGSALPASDPAGRSPGLILNLPDAKLNEYEQKREREDAQTKRAEEVRKLREKLQSGETDADLRQEAFTAALTGLLPLKPYEIRDLLQTFNETQRAVESPIIPYPQPKNNVVTINLDPGALPPVIKLSPGLVTTLTVLDITGAPWPVQDITWTGDFQMVDTENGTHIMRITPLSRYAYGNLSMRLVDLATPVIFTLQTQYETVDYRLDIRVPGYGPFSKTPLVEGVAFNINSVAGDQTLTSILVGRIPDEAKELSVSGVDGRTSAYSYMGRTFLRTPLTLLSPAWDGSAASADGTKVYVMAEAPVVLLSESGKMHRAYLKRMDTKK